MCLELKSDYQKSSRLKSLFRVVYIQGHETNLGFGVLQDTPEKFLDLPGGRGMFPQKILKMESQTG